MKKKIREQIENKIIVQLMDNIIGQKHHQHHHVHIHQKKKKCDKQTNNRITTGKKTTTKVLVIQFFIRDNFVRSSVCN